MYENFIKLEEEKKQRILNAAFEVFAKHGYKRASTLDICKRADISKGALFHYFENKRNLYFYLYDIGVNKIMNAMNLKEAMKIDDFFLRMGEVTKSKMRAMQEHPYIYAFFVKVYIEEDESVKQELTTRLYALAKDQSVLLENIDTSKFRKENNLKLLSNLIVNFAVEYLQAGLMLNEKADVQVLVNGFQVYMDMLKDNFYKEEFL